MIVHVNRHDRQKQSLTSCKLTSTELSLPTQCAVHHLNKKLAVQPTDVPTTVLLPHLFTPFHDCVQDSSMLRASRSDQSPGLDSTHAGFVFLQARNALVNPCFMPSRMATPISSCVLSVPQHRILGPIYDKNRPLLTVTVLHAEC